MISKDRKAFLGVALCAIVAGSAGCDMGGPAIEANLEVIQQSQVSIEYGTVTPAAGELGVAVVIVLPAIGADQMGACYRIPSNLTLRVNGHAPREFDISSADGHGVLSSGCSPTQIGRAELSLPADTGPLTVEFSQGANKLVLGPFAAPPS